MEPVRFAMAQVNPTVGDLQGNKEKVIKFISDARSLGCDIVILPELSLPRTRLADFEKLVCALNVIAFVGVDYRLNHTTRQARNEGHQAGINKEIGGGLI